MFYSYWQYGNLNPTGNGKRWAEGDAEESDQRSHQGPPGGHLWGHPDWPVHLWEVQKEEVYLHPGNHTQCFMNIDVGFFYTCTFYKHTTFFRFKLEVLMNRWQHSSSALNVEIGGRYIIPFAILFCCIHWWISLNIKLTLSLFNLFLQFCWSWGLFSVCGDVAKFQDHVSVSWTTI